jgi:uncharacterized protein YndB with AHSA1/START domain
MANVSNLEKAQVSLPSDREVKVMRSFKAPRELVYEAMTTPALLQRWMSIPERPSTSHNPEIR